MSDDPAEDALDALLRHPPERRPTLLSARYLRDVALVEELPENQDGADKTWVLRLAAEMARLRRSVVRLR